MGEIIIDDEIPYGDEIRLDGGWVDLISSAKQISSELVRISSRLRDFIKIIEITVDENDCIVANMDYISFSMMYKYGGAKYGGMNIPINERASELFVKLYETTAISPSQYKDGNLFFPEILVKGNIKPKGD